MTDKTKILAEIERLKMNWRLGMSAEAKYRVEAYTELIDFINSLPEEPVSNVWHDAQIDPPQAKKKILAINEYCSCEVDYAINMALYWPKVIKWAYIDDLLKLDNSCQSCENLQEESVSKDYIERYKNITQSDAFKSAYENKSLGEVMSVEGEKPVSEDIQKIGSLKSFEYYPEKKTTNKTDRGVFDANMPRRKAYLRGFKDGAHAHKELLANKPVSEDLEEAASLYVADDALKPWQTMVKEAFKGGAKWQKQQDSIPSNDLAELIDTLSKRYPEVSFAKLSRIAVCVAKWQKKQDQSTIELAEEHAYFAGRTKTIDEINEALLSEVLPCFMHGGEADEVVAKLDEVLNQKK